MKTTYAITPHLKNVLNLNSQQLLELYQDGHSEAATAIFDRYVARLIALVRRRIGSKLKRRIDAEDVVQSAYRSFFVHAKGSAYQLAEVGDLWRLLASITLNKLHKQIEKQTAAKRSIRLEEPADISTTNVVAPEPSAAEVVAIAEELHLAINRLSDKERMVVVYHLQGQSVAEISDSFDKSERTVRRLLASAIEKVEQQLLATTSAETPLRLVVTDHNAPLQYSDYVLENLLGAGGMGKVFRAREVKTERTVAVKTLHKSWQADVRAIAQFVQESNILAKLKHPNIVGVQGLGRFPAGGYFIVMDFVDGTSLQAQLKDCPLPVADALAIIKQVADAIGYAHENGIVHCDLKPANILLSKAGHVTVTDFGFAFVAAATPVNLLNGIGGTLGYIAPEILQSHNKPTPAADIYALGALLWLLVTGILPSDSFAIENSNKELAPVAKIVRCCLSRDPRERFQNAKELQMQIKAMHYNR